MPRRIVIALILFLCGAAPAHAQTGSIAVGMTDLPDVLWDPCSGSELHGAIEARAGLRRGAGGVELRTTFQFPVTQVYCAVDPIVFREGVHTEVSRPYDSDALLGSDLRAFRHLVGPVVVGAGGGWLWSHRLPYGLASVGLRTRGRVHLLVEVERQWMRITEEYHTWEWQDFRPVRFISSRTEHRWVRGDGLRIGVGLAR